MGFSDRIERTVEIGHPGLGVGRADDGRGPELVVRHRGDVDLRPGGSARMSWDNGFTVDMRVERVEQFLAALARNWDRQLAALTTHLDRSARTP